jgi:predicted component of type VI protein secretion system
MHVMDQTQAAAALTPCCVPPLDLSCKLCALVVGWLMALDISLVLSPQEGGVSRVQAKK